MGVNEKAFTGDLVHDVKAYRLNSMIVKHIEGIKNRRYMPTAKGNYKYCYMFGNVAILKNIDKYAEDAPILKEPSAVFLERCKITNYLKKNLKINTPSLIGMYTTKHHYYEVQDRAEGNILSVHDVTTAKSIMRSAKKPDGLYVFDTRFSANDREREERILPYEESEIGHAMYLYNLNIQKQLKECDQKMFDKFVKDFKLLTKNGINIDTKSENFLFNKTNGFTFIDIDTKVYDGIKTRSDDVIAHSILDVFSDFTKFINYMKPGEIKTITHNKDIIMDRVLLSIKKNNFKLSPAAIEGLNFRAKSGQVLYQKICK